MKKLSLLAIAAVIQYAMSVPIDPNTSSQKVRRSQMQSQTSDGVTQSQGRDDDGNTWQSPSNGGSQSIDGNNMFQSQGDTSGLGDMVDIGNIGNMDFGDFVDMGDIGNMFGPK